MKQRIKIRWDWKVCGAARHSLRVFKRLEQQVHSESVRTRRALRRQKGAFLKLETLLDVIAREVKRLGDRLP